MDLDKFQDAKFMVRQISNIEAAINYYETADFYLCTGCEEILQDVAATYKESCLQVLEASLAKLRQEFAEL